MQEQDQSMYNPSVSRRKEPIIDYWFGLLNFKAMSLGSILSIIATGGCPPYIVDVVNNEKPACVPTYLPTYLPNAVYLHLRFCLAVNLFYSKGHNAYRYCLSKLLDTNANNATIRYLFATEEDFISLSGKSVSMPIIVPCGFKNGNEGDLSIQHKRRIEMLRHAVVEAFDFCMEENAQKPLHNKVDVLYNTLLLAFYRMKRRRVFPITVRRFDDRWFLYANHLSPQARCIVNALNEAICTLSFADTPIKFVIIADGRIIPTSV